MRQCVLLLLLCTWWSSQVSCAVWEAPPHAALRCASSDPLSPLWAHSPKAPPTHTHRKQDRVILNNKGRQKGA